MKLRILTILTALLVAALPLWAQNIPAGDDKWDSVGGGSTNVTLSSADWAALCGAGVGDTTVNLKGKNLPGQGTADTIVTRLTPANFSGGATQTVSIKLKSLTMVSTGSHPCSPATLYVTALPQSAQLAGTMTITRLSSAGGNFQANVPVSVDIVAKNSSGVPVGATINVNGTLSDISTSPWSYTQPSGAGSPGQPWYPSTDPATQQPAKTCRRGNKILPAIHCYQPPPPCGRTAATADGKAVTVIGTNPGTDINFISTCIDDVEISPANPVDLEPVEGEGSLIVKN